jgi:hypothetical protein
VRSASDAPRRSAGSNITIPAGGEVARTGSFVDPGTDTWTATVDYGDGTGVQPLALTPTKDFTLDHFYGQTGTYTVTGGAGAFANATGSGTISTQIDLCANTASGTYTGTISQPNSN